MYPKRTYIHIALYLLFVLAVWMAFTFAPSPRIVQVEWQDGILDLTDADFEGTVYYYADNRWDNYPEHFYIPADFAGENPPATNPMSYDDFRRVQYATHRTQLRLPPGQIYALSMKTADYAMRIFIDENEVDCVGLPADNPTENVPRVSQRSYVFNPDGETTAVLVQSSNWVHKEGAYHPNFYVGMAENIAEMNRHDLLLTLLITGCLLTSFLYYLGVYLLNPKRLPTLVFSLCCLLLMLMVSNIVPVLFPNYNWFLEIKLQYIVRYLTFAGLALFLDVLFPKLLHKLPTRVFYTLAALYTFFTLLAPTELISRVMIGFEAASALMILYILARLFWQLRVRKPQHILAFAGTALVCFFGVNDMLYHNNIIFLGPLGGQLFTTPIAMTFYVFCYGLVLALEYAETERAMLLALESEQRLAADNAALNRLSHMKSDLMATVSHETRTPLAVLSGYAELISMELRQKGVDAQTTCDLDRIAEEIQRIAAIMEEMQNYARERENAEQKAWISLAEVIQRSARLYAPILERKNTRLLVALPDELPLIFANAGELTQVLFNLLQNAKNYTENGIVTLRAESEGNGIAVTVADTGEGISPELLPDIYSRGVSGKENGTGIGLSVCKEIIEGHGGTITIQSTPGEGTVVRFTLPNDKEDGYGHANDGLIG